MNDSFELLSSMSPKLKGGQKTVKKGNFMGFFKSLFFIFTFVLAIKILALKKHFRRSSIYDKAPAVNNQDLAIVEVSSEDSSINIKNNASKDNLKDNKKVVERNHIIIDSTDSEDFFIPQPKTLSSKPLKKCDEKVDRIQEWLDNMEMCHKKDNLTFFSQVSTVFGDETQKDGDGLAASSTFNEHITRRFDELFVTSKHDLLKHNPKDDSICNDSFLIEMNTSLRSKLEKKMNDGGKNISTSFEESSDGSVNLRKAIIDLKDSNEAKIVIDETLLTSDESISKASNSFKTPKLSLDRTPEKALSNQVDHVAIRKKTGTILQEPQNNTLDISMEMKTILDSLYGVKWRINENHVLPLTEPKKKPVETKKKKNFTPNTERIFKPDKKNQNNLRPATKKINFNKLQTPIASPWMDRLKGLVDSDSEADISETKEKARDIENVKTRLSFSEDSPVIKTNDAQNTPKIPKSNKDYPKKGGKENRPLNENKVKDKNTVLQNENKEKRSLENGKKKSTATGANNKMVPPKSNTFKEKSSSSSCSEIEISSDEEYDNEITRMYKIKRKSMKAIKEERYSFLESLSAYVPLDKCDLTARIFRTSFKNYRDELKSKLFSLYNKMVFDNAIPNDTQLEWNDKLRNTAGLCYCKKITHRDGKVTRQVKISLSSKVLDSPDRLRDTLIHEMCHAGTWIVNQISNGHGVYWKNWAFKAMKVFPELPPIKRCHSYQIHTKYTYKCTGCGYSFGRHSKSLDTERKRCGHCYGKFALLINKTGETRAVPVTPRKQATPFSLFVKENYALYKEPTRKHGDVMKILGQKFSQMKVKNN